MENIVVALMSSISTVSVIAIVGYLLRTWIATRLRWSVKHEYDMKMLEVENQKEIRLKGEVVAELLAEWIRKNGNLDYHQLNKLTFQAFLWLPKELAEDLSNCLARKQGAKDVRKILIDIRTHLHGSSDGLQAKDVIVFDEPEMLRNGIKTSLVFSELSKIFGVVGCRIFRLPQACRNCSFVCSLESVVERGINNDHSAKMDVMRELVNENVFG